MPIMVYNRETSSQLSNRMRFKRNVRCFMPTVHVKIHIFYLK